VIVAVIAGTIGIQVYWNYKNYEVNKQQLFNEVQTSLDNAVETYYANLAVKSTFGFTIEGASEANMFNPNGKFDSIVTALNVSRKEFSNLDSLTFDIKKIGGIQVFKGSDADSLLKSIQDHKSFTNKPLEDKIRNDKKTDSSIIHNYKTLTSKVVFSLAQDSLDLASIDTLVKQEILRKNLNIDYGLSLNTTSQETQTTNSGIIGTATLSALSNSTYLPKGSNLKIYFTNTTKVILKRILTGVLVSTVLVLAVISCLFYLLNIIKHQKQIAEVKNDFISNITHEFKTPIATIGVALESIKDFNVLNHPEKTTSYIDMSNAQLGKLNMMVEKLLDTASLESESLQLKKEPSNVTDLTRNLVDKHTLESNNKTLTFDYPEKDVEARIDVFHFENAINNIIDNAIKYGGRHIKINLEQNTIGFIISIADNGNTLTKTNKDKIFEKFYRIPKGNTHDVKGFGIGLYYAKKIIEKHDGSLILNLDSTWTTFKISVPNE
jgi:two-component system phosphate regulon sensor histidine kinase PhoR